MTTSQPIDDTVALELRTQDELGRSIAPSQEKPRDEATLPPYRASMRCSTGDRELFKHDFSKYC
jgi:hypothetical protein